MIGGLSGNVFSSTVVDVPPPPKKEVVVPVLPAGSIHEDLKEDDKEEEVKGSIQEIK